jgi:hypothetical protein
MKIMTLEQAISELAIRIGEKAEFYTTYLSRGNKLTVFADLGHYIVVDKWDTVVAMSFPDGSEIDLFEEMVGEKMVPYMKNNGTKTEIQVDED